MTPSSSASSNGYYPLGKYVPFWALISQFLRSEGQPTLNEAQNLGNPVASLADTFLYAEFDRTLKTGSDYLFNSRLGKYPLGSYLSPQVTWTIASCS